MEWTKENVRKTFIETKTDEERKHAVKFYMNLGYYVTPLEKEIKETEMVMIGGSEFIIFGKKEKPKRLKFRKINPFPKPRRKFPRTMLVSDDNKKWERRVVVGKIKSNAPYVVSINGKALEEGQVFKFLLAFKYAKEEITK